MAKLPWCYLQSISSAYWLHRSCLRRKASRCRADCCRRSSLLKDVPPLRADLLLQFFACLSDFRELSDVVIRTARIDNRFRVKRCLVRICDGHGVVLRTHSPFYNVDVEVRI